MARENAADKGRRYLTEGRLEVLYVKPHDMRIRATCRGESGETYKLGYSPAKWFCDCPVLTDQCSHLNALRLVTQVPRPEGSPF